MASTITQKITFLAPNLKNVFRGSDYHDLKFDGEKIFWYLLDPHFPLPHPSGFSGRTVKIFTWKYRFQRNRVFYFSDMTCIQCYLIILVNASHLAQRSRSVQVKRGHQTRFLTSLFLLWCFCATKFNEMIMIKWKMTKVRNQSWKEKF